MSGATPVYKVKTVYRRCTSAGCWPHPLLFHPYIAPNAQCNVQHEIDKVTRARFLWPPFSL